MSLYLLHFSNCITIKGANRGLIIDTQRNRYYTVPNALCDILIKFNGCQIDEIMAKLGRNNDDRSILLEYIEFLELNEIVFLSPINLKDNLPKIENSFYSSSKLMNAVIDFKKSNFNNAELILSQLSNLQCKHLEVQISDNFTLTEIIDLLEIFNEIEFDSVALYISRLLSPDEIALLGKMLSDINCISICRIYNSNPSKSQVDSISPFGELFEFINFDYSNEKLCGKVNSDYWNTGLTHYTESLAHNTCLNRKIAIDAEGNIKNCPSMKESFGNIKDTTLEEAINKPGFKKYWNIKKDDITKCKDCEFRHVCTDCRAYIENPEDIYSAPLKCGYDPYTCEWEEWSTNPLKQKAIDFYGFFNEK